MFPNEPSSFTETKMLVSAEQEDEKSEDVTDEHDALDDTNTTKTDASDILSLNTVESDTPPPAHSAQDGT